MGNNRKQWNVKNLPGTEGLEEEKKKKWIKK